ncbi:HAD family hydrolase [Halorhabdus rudnickae]|uniref:HAD family hydrolase n=1 Tax=Halorhabdus rudnickae TaxID=1775544 RepID=UPI0010823D7E|nr:HAD family hydrolase [Halorhabdus rudnickae]
MYDAIVFDLDGVLLTGYHTAPAVYRQATVTALADFDAATNEPPAELVMPDDVATIRRLCERFDVPAASYWGYREHAATELENDWIREGEREPFPDVDVLETLAESGELAIASNNRHGTVRFVRDYFPWGDHFEAAYGRAPTLPGYDRMKPDPHYLQTALDALGVKPGNALFVGDRLSDVETADRAGADSALLVREGDRPEGDPEPTFEIESLEGLLAVEPPTE